MEMKLAESAESSPLDRQAIHDAAIESLTAQSRALSLMAQRIGPEFARAAEILLACSGRVVVSGMGKSGLVGKKIAATLASTGTPSFFMHPAEALHGDLGMVRRDDVLLLISNSGETEEILRILPTLFHFGNKLIAMVGSMDSTLAKNADVVLDISVERETCPLNLAPTTSTLATMAMGDALAVSLMRQRDFQPRDFALFHPGGNLGRRLLTRVQDAMHRTLPIVASNTPLRETMVVMTSGRLGLALVLDAAGELVGLFTDGDLRRALSTAAASMHDPVEQYMTKKPKTTFGNTMLAEAEETMHAYKIRCLVVLDEETRKPVGLVEIFDR
jgi:arabinose-5-phosphate isomerase